jgi:lysozyme family protein
MTFEECFQFVLKHEGGYVNDPEDPGGETKYGISKRAHPDEDIENLTEKDAAEIYRHYYWRKAYCELLPPTIRLAVFDGCVNQGVDRTVRILQELTRVHVDGIMGPITINAAFSNGPELKDFLIARANYYLQSKRFNRFGRGWMLRLFAVFRQTTQIHFL